MAACSGSRLGPCSHVAGPAREPQQKWGPCLLNDNRGDLRDHGGGREAMPGPAKPQTCCGHLDLCGRRDSFSQAWISEPLRCCNLAHPDLCRCSQDQGPNQTQSTMADTEGVVLSHAVPTRTELPRASYSKCSPWSMTQRTSSGLPRPAGREAPADGKRGRLTGHLLHLQRLGPLP